jgi:hypothetical protein
VTLEQIHSKQKAFFSFPDFCLGKTGLVDTVHSTGKKDQCTGRRRSRTDKGTGPPEKGKRKEKIKIEMSN